MVTTQKENYFYLSLTTSLLNRTCSVSRLLKQFLLFFLGGGGGWGKKDFRCFHVKYQWLSKWKMKIAHFYECPQVYSGSTRRLSTLRFHVWSMGPKSYWRNWSLYRGIRAWQIFHWERIEYMEYSQLYEQVSSIYRGGSLIYCSNEFSNVSMTYTYVGQNVSD